MHANEIPRQQKNPGRAFASPLGMSAKPSWIGRLTAFLLGASALAAMPGWTSPVAAAAPSDETVLAVRECADRVAEAGSPIAVHSILARVDNELGLWEDTEMHYEALLVCRPLWVPYAVQLAEHQAKRDIKRAFATIEAARKLFGPNFWLPL